MKVAILVDGGFYRRRSVLLWGVKSAKDRADELQKYCLCHMKGQIGSVEPYRILYYDCPPLSGFIYDPLRRRNVNMEKSPTFKWANDFISELARKRKFAIRRGVLLQSDRGCCFTKDATKNLLSGKLKLEDVTDEHLTTTFQQKGVDMKIGIDMIHLAYRKLVDRIVLITGDSDFVPAAKMARIEGVDVILDSMGAKVTDSLVEHVDGIDTHWASFALQPPDDR